jgi:2-amino-4-hydroxy-6-hydroxymethyldihydropteridine diphosphokinase
VPIDDDIAYVALGSNLGDRAGHLRAALDAIDASPGAAVLKCSPLLETEPVGPSGQGRYLNAVACVRAAMSPEQLMRRLLEIEAMRGRDRSAGLRWGARTLDLDLLVFGERVLEQPGLTLPHPRLGERLFVLQPWRMIAPALVVPGLGQTVESLARALEAGGIWAPGAAAQGGGAA